MNDRLSEIVESGEAERLATGFVFTEGPLWHADGYLLFVDIRRSQIFRLEPGGEPELVRENSGESNGMTFDLQGRQVVCEMINRQVTRLEDDGSYSVLADSWNGQRINRPNDVVGRSTEACISPIRAESGSIRRTWICSSTASIASGPTAQWT